MEKNITMEQENMQSLGLLGVYKESNRIIFSRRKIFTQVSLTLILPLTFILLIDMMSSSRTPSNSPEKITKTQTNTSQHENLTNILSSKWATFFWYKLLFFSLVFIFSLLSTSAVVYTIASTYAGRDVTFNNVIGVVPKVWKRLMVTFLWTAVVFSVVNIIVVLALLICVLIIATQNGVVVTFIIILIKVLIILYIAMVVYMSVVWKFACVVTVLETSYGIEAMRKSVRLIKGKIGLSIVIFFKLFVLSFLIFLLFQIVVVDGGKLFGLSLMERSAFGIVCLLVLSYLVLFQLVIQTVLYFVCKSYRHEIIDKFGLLDHLEVYQGESYQPLLAKDIQLDYHV